MQTSKVKKKKKSIIHTK